MSRFSIWFLLPVPLAIVGIGAAAYLLAQGRGAATSPAAAHPDGGAPTVTPKTAFLPAAPPLVPSPVPSLQVTIQDGELTRSVKTEAATVAQLLAEAGISMTGNDRVQPAPEEVLVDGMQVQIARAIPLTIHVDGQALAIFSAARTAAEVLAGAGITLGELDRTDPGPEGLLKAGDVLRVIRVREETITEDEEVPFQTVYQPSDELDLDTKSVLTTGAPGIKRRSTRIRYEDGVEVGREVAGEWMEREVVNQVIGYGTRITTHVIETPEGPREYWRVVKMRVTAYTAASSGKAPDHPAYGITASGLPAGTGIVAVDPNVVPFRSEVYVPGYGIGFAGDTGGGVKGRWIDLGYDEDELQAWNGYVDVYYLTPLPAEINYLLPEVLP
jgi:3D (Asp-Asp-Asp) domain-containing protein